MPTYTKESLEALRRKIDLVDVLSSHIDLKRTGASYKANCPFHDEKTPSFMIQRGDTHYHCFGCGAHGDAISFLMNYQKLSFLESVQSLAEKFSVPLEIAEGKEEEKVQKKSLKEALNLALQFYHFQLLHTKEGHEALNYLYKRGLNIEFIRQFKVGFSSPHISLRKLLHQKFISDEMLLQAGLIKEVKNHFHDFFSDRILFPIHDGMGAVIGFSGRKYKEETFGGKYINTPETPLFKKSRVLFGLNYSRRRIAKERKAIIVEGQIDALRLIQEGFNITVAGQGTAFGEEHVRELLHLGVQTVYLSLDGDKAGKEATLKIGQLFQKEGVDVKVLLLPQGVDPDSFLKTYGGDAFLDLMEKGEEYLSFVVKEKEKEINTKTPAGKNELILEVVKQIRSWNQPVMVHEALKKLSQMMKVPEEMVGVGQNTSPNLYLKKSASVGTQTIDPDKVLECDLLRLLFINPTFLELIQHNLKEEDFHHLGCKKLYALYLHNFSLKKPLDLLSLSIDMGEEAQELISEMMEKKVNREKSLEHLKETIQKILDRNWMEKREEIKRKIQSGQSSEEEVLHLVKEFNALTRKMCEEN